MTTTYPEQRYDQSINDLLRIADPPLDHIVEDDEEDSIPGENGPTLQGLVNGNPVIFKNGKLMPPTAPLSKGRGSGPVDLDDTVIDDSDDTVETTEASSDDNQDNDTALEPHPIDLDSLQEREENFSMIFREHEDEFLVWKGNEQLQKMALKNAQLSRSRQPKKYGQSCRGGKNSFSHKCLPLQNDNFQGSDADREHTIVFYEGDAVQEIKYNEPCEDDDQSMDTYGFSLAEASVDSYGFSVKGSNARSRQSTDVSVSKTAVSTSEESRARTIQRIKEVLKKDQDQASQEGDSSTVEGLGAKARGLRALRLRKNNYEKMNTVHEEEELQSPQAPVLSPRRLLQKQQEEGSSREEQKEANGAIEYPGNFGLVVQIADDKADPAAQSVVSDITTLSDKLFLRVKPEPESKWDDVSSVGLTGVEGRPETPDTSRRQDDPMYAQEMEGHNVENPPFSFDSDDKTPPFLFNPRGSGPADTEGKWDDVSSIGLAGVETKRKSRKDLPPPKPLEVRIPSVISSSGSHPSRDSRHSHPQSVRKSQDVFRSQQVSDNNVNKKTKHSSQVQITRTFSTEPSGASFESDHSGEFVDPEMQMVKEVSSCTSEISDESKETSIDQTCKLTPRDWLIVAAILLLVVTAVAIAVFYVYANL
ncbi:MAG: hypothetical protein SGILL_008730 [Bacillariaceae sp.]